VANAAKAKGTRWELAVRRFLRAAGIDVFKPYEEGRDDAGDIHGMDPFVGQAKAYASIVTGIREGVAGAERQALVAKLPFGVAIVKRPGKATGEAYVVMTLATFARLLRWMRGLPAEDTPCDPGR
jgi:hypothetical protein